MLGTLVNAAAIIAGTAIGVFLKKGLPEKLADTLMKGVGLCTMFLGISGSLKGENSLILILSIVIGTLIGEGIDLEEKIGRLGLWVEGRFKKTDGEKATLAEGFVTASLLFCVGAMAIVGSLQSGLMENHEMLFGKSILDFIISVVLASTLGVGVAFSSALVFLYQGSITLLAQWVAPFLTDTVIAEMTCVGSVVMIGLGLNIIGITRLRVMNYIPAIFIPIILCRFL